MIFLILLLFWLSETDQIWGFQALSGNPLRKWPEILHADVSWILAELIRLWLQFVDFSRSLLNIFQHAYHTSDAVHLRLILGYNQAKLRTNRIIVLYIYIMGCIKKQISYYPKHLEIAKDVMWRNRFNSHQKVAWYNSKDHGRTLVRFCPCESFLITPFHMQPWIIYFEHCGEVSLYHFETWLVQNIPFHGMILFEGFLLPA